MVTTDSAYQAFIKDQILFLMSLNSPGVHHISTHGVQIPQMSLQWHSNESSTGLERNNPYPPEILYVAALILPALYCWSVEGGC